MVNGVYKLCQLPRKVSYCLKVKRCCVWLVNFPLAKMVSKTVLLLWCLVVSVCWMSETEAWSALNPNTMKGKRSIMKVRLLLGYLSTCAPLIFLYFSVDMKSNNSYLYASISKALLPINPNLHDKSSTFLLTSISLFVFFFCLFVCFFRIWGIPKGTFATCAPPWKIFVNLKQTNGLLKRTKLS